MAVSDSQTVKRHIPTWLLAVPLAPVLLKLIAIVAFRLDLAEWSDVSWVLHWDPMPAWLAEQAVGLLFDSSRFLPTASEAIAFDAFLLLATGCQWYGVARLVRWTFRRPR